MNLAGRLALALARPLGRLALRTVRGGGHLLLRLGKMTGLALIAGAVIFLLDMLLVRDEGRPDQQP